MHSGSGGRSHSRHRKTVSFSHKFAALPSGKVRAAEAAERARAESEAKAQRDARRALQDFRPIELWLADRGHDHKPRG